MRQSRGGSCGKARSSRYRKWAGCTTAMSGAFQGPGKDAFLHCFESEHDFMLVHPLCCNDDRAGEIGPTFHFMTRHDLVLTNDSMVYTPSNVSIARRKLPSQLKSGNEFPCGASSRCSCWPTP